ncbi:protein ZNF365-like isoform X4 [Girardinichthys multiradiatus]|nr:protein ZNF365-like isoform X4 [Girardinichthys multiradiatus]
MQQTLCSRGSGSFLLERNGQACGAITDSATSCDLPFRCPRCGEQERFRSLASLRAHLEYRHSYRSPDVIAGDFSITGKHPDPLTAAIPWQDMSLPTRRGQQGTARPPHVRSLSDSRDSGYLQSYSSVRRRTQSVGVGTQAEEEEGVDDEDTGEEEEEEEDGEEANETRDESDNKMSSKKSDTGHHHHPSFPPASLDPPLDLDTEPESDLVAQSLYSGLETAAASAAVRRRLASILRAADGTMQRRLAKVSTELARTDTELLCERAHSQHLAQERQEVADRERSLSRQVDVAVMVIAALREQLNASENELERREREVITIQRFLEAAARQETSGKVRIQRFIENLLGRITLAEKLVEFYQVNGSPAQCEHYKQNQNQADNGHYRISKSRSAGGQLFSSGLHDNRTQSSSQFSGAPQFSKAGVDRERERQERLAQSSRLFCRPEHRDDIWNHQQRRSTGKEQQLSSSWFRCQEKQWEHQQLCAEVVKCSFKCCGGGPDLVGTEQLQRPRSRFCCVPVSSSVPGTVPHAGCLQKTLWCRWTLKSRVTFRYTEKEGLRLGLVGWVKNTSRGTVVGQVQGPADMVEEMKVWLSKEGSPTSRITKAKFTNQKTIDKVEFSGFKTRF